MCEEEVIRVCEEEALSQGMYQLLAPATPIFYITCIKGRWYVPDGAALGLMALVLLATTLRPVALGS